MRLIRRRPAPALVALAWLALQFGFATHGPMQLGAALGGPLHEICTSAGLVPAPADPSSPAGNRTQTPGLCDLCAAATLPALAAAAVLAVAASAREPAARPALPAARAQDAHRRANRSRAPPTLPA